MKRLVGTFLVVLVLLFGFLLFGGSLILGSFEGRLGFAALAVTVLVLALDGQERRTAKLEERVRALEERLAGQAEEKEEST